MESALITTPPISSAKASAWADLPLAVGPAIRTASNFTFLPFVRGTMFVLNVIGKGADPHLFDGLGSGDVQILSPFHAFDLPVTDSAALTQARVLAGGRPWDINLVMSENR